MRTASLAPRGPPEESSGESWGMRAPGSAISHGASGLQSRVTNVQGSRVDEVLEAYVASSMQCRESVIMHGCIVDIAEFHLDSVPLWHGV